MMETTYSLFSVQNNVICISGSSRGLGKTIAYSFAKAGANVILSAHNEEELKQTIQEFNAQKLACAYIVADVSKEQDCKNMVSYCIDTFGRIDTMICNAGIDSIKPAITVTESEWDKILAVNLRGLIIVPDTQP